jgi:phosphoglycolate phosphatase-like HAD superfamily hydrolase
MAAPMLEATGINALFSAVVDYATTSRRKPHPDPLLCAAQQLAVETGRCWYVGDDPNDAAAAVAAGIRFAWAAWGYTAQPPSGTDRVMHRPGDVTRLHGRTT